MRIFWDEPKRQTNFEKHRMDFADLDPTFFSSSLIVPGKRGRSIAIGRLNGIVTVVFVSLGVEAVSVISMRPASAKERRML